MTCERHVRFCERLGVKLPGATLPPATLVNPQIVLWINIEPARNGRRFGDDMSLGSVVLYLAPLDIGEPKCRFRLGSK